MSPKRRAQMVSSETAQMLEHFDHSIQHEKPRFIEEHENEVELPVRANNQEPIRVAIVEGDIIDVAVDWQSYRTFGKGHKDLPAPRCWRQHGTSGLDKRSRVLLLNAADDRSPGGEWIEGTLGPEEELARRSNLVKTLDTAVKLKGTHEQYTIPRFGGIYSPAVTIFREGPEQDYATWSQNNLHTLSVLSITPARRPKVQSDSPGSPTTQRYAFDQERSEQMRKMQVALRIAAKEGHTNLCLNGFGCAGKFRNPLSEVIRLWHEVLIASEEFNGYFENVVIAVQPGTKEMWQQMF
ncbi:hypothetical protein BJ508DRAFT_231469 [Ascobolus immersus RN42]|uniref:Microbial-type PARG catalytic domain-containing protein n=1 Tax=Ascobolus immersus RN42 TaxID=1160509 RepID=A0A3N4HJV6_ASCIM|nr:hypothetical protein BJ508DRAFT_231469 [Ascobolus immersus RN42]